MNGHDKQFSCIIPIDLSTVGPNKYADFTSFIELTNAQYKFSYKLSFQY